MPKKTSRYSLDDSLGHLASNASRAVLRRINQELSRRKLPITSEQFSVLVHVWDQNGSPQYVLTEELYKDKTAMARVLSSIESVGLIVRMPGQVDRREKLVFLTRKGRDMMSEVADLVSSILDEAQEGIPVSDLQVCKSVLRRFHRNLM
jgi:DNA-binding MarR family transcriptional regulator